MICEMAGQAAGKTNGARIHFDASPVRWLRLIFPPYRTGGTAARHYLLGYFPSDGIGTVSAVPQTGAAFLAVRGLVIDEEHLRLGAGDLHLHFGTEGGLDHLPANLRICLLTVKKGAAARPELTEIGLVVPALVVEPAQQFPAQGDAEGFGVLPPTSNTLSVSRLPLILLTRSLEDSHTHGEVKSPPRFLSA